MIIKTFVAESAAAALKQVRSDMGGNAIVLKTRQLQEQGGPNQVEITACLDRPTAEQASNTLTGSKSLSTNPSRTNSRVESAVLKEAASTTVTPLDNRLDDIACRLQHLEQIQTLKAAGQWCEIKSIADAMKAMKSADVPDEFIESFISELRAGQNDEIDREVIHRALTSKIASIIDPQYEFKTGDRVLLAGPVGAGKTSVVGKLAFHLVSEKKIQVKLMSLDNHKVGAWDEIASYGELLDVDVAGHDERLDKTPKTNNVILIDSGGVPIDAEEVMAFGQRIEELQPTHRFLVLSALTRTSDVLKIIDRVESLGLTHLVLTMADLTNCWGAVTALQPAGLKLALITNSPSGSGLARIPEASQIAATILRQEVEIG